MRRLSHCRRSRALRVTSVLSLFLLGVLWRVPAPMAFADDGARSPQGQEASDPTDDSLADLEKVISDDNGKTSQVASPAPSKTTAAKASTTAPKDDSEALPPEDDKAPSAAAKDAGVDADADADLGKLQDDTKGAPAAASSKNQSSAQAPSADDETLPDDAEAMPSDSKAKSDSAQAPSGDGTPDTDPDEDLPPEPETTKPQKTVEVAKPAPAKPGMATNELPPISEPAPPEVSVAPKSAPIPVLPPAAAEEKTTISNLEFRMNGPGSRIILSYQGKAPYREERNEALKQIVYYFPNSETPQRLQRAYDTTEFQSPVSLFTLLQLPGSNESKLIVQLREDKVPQVQRSLNSIYIDFPPPDHKVQPAKVVVGEDNNTSTEENIYASGKTFTGNRIKQLEVKNSDVQDVLRLIAKSSGYNIVVGDDVQGKVGTLSLENIPWDQAFTLVLQTKKLGYVRQGNVLRVATLGSLKSEKDEALANETAKLKVEPLRTVLIPISYAKAAEIAPRAKSFLTERGTVETDVRTNTVIIKDVDMVVQRVQKLFIALDTQPPRVSIAAKIVEMDSDFKRSIGFSNLSFNESFAGINASFSNPLTSGGASITTISAPNFANLNSQFNLGESEAKVKVLANPSLSVVANQEATVNQSFSFFIPVVTPSAAGGVPLQTVQQITANLKLDVTPIVAGDGSIIMTVAVNYDIPNNAGTQSTIDSRAINTQVLVENGDTAVIGGVFSNTVTNNRYGVPFLSHVPVLGFFFSSTDVEDTRKEIYIFLTAKVLNPEEAFKRAY